MAKEDDLSKIAKRLRIHSLKMSSKAGSGHPTTCMSMADILACLMFDEMRFDIKNPNNLSNDELVLSKGHASPILWAAYAEAGIIPIKKLETYRQFGSPLEGHPTPNMPWIKAATGSLGQGLSIGVGMAMANALHNNRARVFVIMGDGECAEGSVWEAVEFAKKYDVQNLCAIVDCNRLGQSGESLHGHDIEKWRQKFAAFGWNAFTIDGHSIKEILRTLSEVRTMHGPSVIIAKTIKGKGVSFLENKEGWHGKALNEEELSRALRELGEMPNIDARKFVRAPSKWREPKVSTKIPHPSPFGGEFSTREAYGVSLASIGNDERIIALDGDVKNSTFSEKFKAIHPERFIDCYIAEQNMIGVSQGLASKGFIPFASTFAAFLTRAHDQLRMAGISRANIKVCGSHCGVSIGEDGPSQMGLEDLALFRSIPESIVLYPSDAVCAQACVRIAREHSGLFYIRTTRPKLPVIYHNESFHIGGSHTLRSSSKDKAAIVAAGVTVHEALKAENELERNGIKVRVIDAYSVKPLDEKTLRSVAKKMPIIVVEDHYKEGGLGEAVASLGIPITHLCVNEIPRSGKPAELMAFEKIDAKAIIAAVKKL